MKRLPEIDFRSRPNFPQLEDSILEYWDDIQAFQRSITERPESKPYVFYDGPPFVTGSPHYGSILGSIAKDVVPRFWTMRGYRVERQWGWDCHGLPIENMIEKSLNIRTGKKGIEEFGIANFNNACRTAIAEFDATWEVIIRRIGRWVDFKKSYKTMDKTYMESVWWAFKTLSDKDLIYQGRKVILYCPRCATPLSNFEIAMDNSYVDVEEWGTTYKFAVDTNTYVLAWSTTPWTKIGTMALAVHPDLTYVVATTGGEEKYILAESRLSELVGETVEILEKFSGAELVEKYPKFEAHFPWAPLTPEELNKSYRLVADEFVTNDAGTGVVTLAVYGEDDYRVMQQHGIPLYDYVNEVGRLDDTIQQPEWVGKSIWQINESIDEDLEQRNLIYKREKMTHSVATCYRCGTRLYYAPLPAWFVDVQTLKPQLLEQNEPVNWYPDYLKHGRFQKGIESAPDWNISRSRYWGTPIPVWEDESGEHRRIIGSLEELKQWAVNPEQVDSLTDIHREFVDDIAVWLDDEKTIHGHRIPEVFDCWVESGSMPFAAWHYPFENKEKFEAAYPAQFVSEYINQTRAWFYTLHVMSVGLFDQPAAQNIHTTGVILATDGSKMSKSKKNYSDPMDILNKDGADALRLYLMASPVTKAENLAFTDADVTQIRQRVLAIWWNVFAFSQLYKPAGWSATTPKPTHIMDKWILAELAELREQVTTGFESYDITAVSRNLMEFVDQLSTWYLRLSRDRLREGSDLEAWNTFVFVLKTVALLAAPIMPFITEAMFQTLSPDSDSIHLQTWPESLAEFADPELRTQMATLRPVVEEAHAARKANQIKVRQPLAELTVTSAQTKPETVLIEIVLQELNIKAIEWYTEPEVGLSVKLNTDLTPELIEEGKARELVRTLQGLRKDANIPLNAQIKAFAPEWPAEWEAYIKDRVKAVSLEQAPEARIELV